MTNVEKLDAMTNDTLLDEMLADKLFFSFNLHMYSPAYVWAKWIRSND